MLLCLLQGLAGLAGTFSAPVGTGHSVLVLSVGFAARKVSASSFSKHESGSIVALWQSNSVIVEGTQDAAKLGDKLTGQLAGSLQAPVSGWPLHPCRVKMFGGSQ